MWYNALMKLPIIITNFKAYETATGFAAVEMARLHEKVMKETGVSMAVAVKAVDLFRVSSAVSIPVFAQHVDPIQYGAHTGHILPEAVRSAGGFGTLLNHSERRLPWDILEASVARAKEAGLCVVVCAQDPEEGARIAQLAVDFVAVEPPELIGGDVSVSTAQPEVVRRAVELIGRGKTLVGAGVKTAEDVRIALALGASGVLLASGVTKAKDPEAVLRDLARGAVS